MFISSLATWDNDKKYLPNAFHLAMDFLKSLDLKTLQPGTYPIQGDDIFAKVECGIGRSEASRRFEVHHKYIDVQILLSGHERQDYALRSQELEEDRPEEDIAFYSVASDIGTIFLQPLDYVIYFPGELHAPSMKASEPGTYKKIIFKINSQIVR